MILRRLRVQGFRCFRNPVELGGLGVGAHVLFAPNETGKSTLLLALARALFDRYGTGGEEMKALRPWGTTLSPEIHVELETGGKRYLLKKRFLDGVGSELLEWTGTQFERKDDGERADERARYFLLGESSGRGATKLDHWGMARLLWLTQRRERQEPPGMSEPFRQRLLHVVGATMLSDEEQQLLSRVEDEYAKFFTSNTARPTKHSLLVKAKEDLRAAEETAAELQRRWEEAARWMEQIGDAESRLAAAQEEHHRLSAELCEVEGAVRAEEEIEREIQKQESRAKDLAERYEERTKRREAALEGEKTVQQRRAEASAMASSIAAASAKAGADTTDLRAAAEAVSRATSEVERLEQHRDRAQLIADLVSSRMEHRRLQRRVREAVKLSAAITAHEQERAGRSIPSDADIRKCEDLQKKIDTNEAKLDELAIEVAFVPDKAREIAWEGIGPEPSRRVTAGERAVFRGADRGVLTIAGVGKVEIRTGMRDAATLQGQLDGWRHELARRLGEHWAASITALRQARDTAFAANRDLEQLKKALAEVLDEEGEIEELRGALRTCDGRIAELMAALQVSDGDLDELEAPDRQALDDLLTKARKEKTAAEKARQVAEKEAKASEKEADRLEHDRRGKLVEAETLSARLSADAVRFGTPEQLLVEANVIAGDLALARGATQSLQAKLPAPHARASKRQRGIREGLERIEILRREEQRKVDSLQGKIEQAAGEGLYSKLVRAEEHCVLARGQEAWLEQRADGIATLREHAVARRSSTGRSVVVPIENEVRLRLDYIRGSVALGSSITFAPDLGSGHVRTTTAEEAPLEALSWGTQEQVMLALRLALGSMLAEGGAEAEPQLVVLDDALVNTDGIRHARALDLIQSASERLQVLILTAFPERYRTLHATEHDLLALMSR